MDMLLPIVLKTIAILKHASWLVKSPDSPTLAAREQPSSVMPNVEIRMSKETRMTNVEWGSPMRT
jgi:hypothetical protein